MKTQDDMDTMFDSLSDLTHHQRASIKHRYRFLMNEYRYRAAIFSWLFYTMRTTMTVGSLAVPALLSLQTNNNANLYWFTWGLSLAVTTANGITTLFKLENKFLSLHTTMEHIRTETWQYLELAGRYSGHHGHGKPTHSNQYVFYCSHVEKIRMKQVGEEYVKHPEGADAAKPTVQATALVPSPPDQAISSPRRESVHSSGDDSVIEIDKKTKTMSVSNVLRETVPEDSPTRNTILQDTSKV